MHPLRRLFNDFFGFYFFFGALLGFGLLWLTPGWFSGGPYCFGGLTLLCTIPAAALLAVVAMVLPKLMRRLRRR